MPTTIGSLLRRLLTPQQHTALAAATLGDLSIDDAVALADGTAVDHYSSGPVPPYEQWRQRIRDHFRSSPSALAS